jgi:Bacterial SH3 domain
MQKQGLKILIIIALAFFPVLSYSQLNTNLLAKGDSLFQQKRYTQSFEIFRALFDNRQYSPAMLLKMAYIQEGLNHISQSVYYLNLYYIATQDKAALRKLEELAEKYNLEGYTPSEFDRAFAIYREHKTLITLSLVSVLIFFAVLVTIQRLRFQSKPYVSWSILLIFSVILLAHLNFSERNPQAIIISNNTYLMNAPSAGASVISIVRDGHRVQVIGKEDVWLRVTWGDSEAYVKESSLQEVRL